ncbi:MAG: phosphatase PAP2 family protein [Nostocoides sp.]
MPFISRYADDPARPGVRSALRDAALRAVLPGVAVFGVIVAVGLLLKGPLSGLGTSEEGVNRRLVAWRTPAWNTITMLCSHIGNTEYVIGVCVLVAAVIWWRTKQWWYAAVPLLAISLQATIFVLTTLVIARPRPHVSHLDPAPPTSSYPSGHEGASTALYVTFVLMATRIRQPVLRTVVLVVCALVPFLVGFARLYRGMHHVSDVTMGAVNGFTCAMLAWGYLRRDSTAGTAGRSQTLV